MRPAPSIQRSASTSASPLATGRYVPILSLKEAECAALRSLKGAAPGQVYPLLTFRAIPEEQSEIDEASGETIVKKPPTLEQYFLGQCNLLHDLLIPNLFEFGISRAMLDVAALDEQQSESTLAMLDRTLKPPQKRQLVPVVSMGQLPSHALAARRWNKHYTTGLALRYRCTPPAPRYAGQWPSFAAALSTLRDSGGTPADTDLVVDVGPITEDRVSRRLTEVLDILDSVRKQGPWRSVTVVSGAFPRGLAPLELDRYHHLVRWDFVLWKRLKRVLQGQANDVPSYGDYAVVHAAPFTGRPKVPKANIRYTDERNWIIYRREAEPAMETICKLICEEPWYRGADFSRGDEWIRAVANRDEAGGGAPTWMRSALQHHLAFVVLQLRGLT